MGIASRGRAGGGTRVCVATRLDAAPILAGEEERGMANFLEYNPEQAYLLPPTVREVLREGHLRFLAGGARPDFWALNEFRKRHGRAMNDIFTQVVELARSLGLGKLGHVAIDSTRIAANAATGATETLEKLRAERAKIRKNIRRWQQQCASEDPNEGAGLEVARAAME